MAHNIVQNAFRVVEGRAVTSSFKVAEYFGKKHSDVVRAVDDLIAKNQELQVLRNFARYSQTVSLNDKLRRIHVGSRPRLQLALT